MTKMSDRLYHRLMCALLNGVPDATPEMVKKIVAAMKVLNERKALNG